MDRKQNYWLTLLSTPGSHWAWLSVLCYVAACFLPAIRVTSNVSPGYVCLMMVGVIGWWWSNPFYLFALLCYAARLPRTAAFFSATSVLIALHYEITAIAYHELFSGAVMWVTSFQVLTINAWWQAWVDRNRKLQKLSD